MMCISRADLSVGAYISNDVGLFRVQAMRPGRGGISEVALTDESVPLVTEAVPGTCRFRVVEPEPVMVPTHRVLAEFDLRQHGPNPLDTASAAEWGKAG